MVADVSYTTRKPVMNADHADTRNEQLAFVSGTVLAGGVLLVKLWPVVAGMQTGVRANATLARMGAVAPPTVISHRIGALIVALGVGMLLFGTLHVVARGVSLARPALPRDPHTIWATADQIANRAYLIIQLYWMIIGVTLLFCMLAFPLIIVLVRFFRWPPVWSMASATMVIMMIVIKVDRLRVRRGHDTLPASIRMHIGMVNVAIAAAAMLVVWFTAMNFAYVASVSVSHSVVRRSQSELLVVTVVLGGTMSDPRYARLRIVQGRTAMRSLRLRRLGGGSYVALIAPTSLADGDYEIALTYPHSYIALGRPVFSRTLERRVGFVVVP